ncbi:carbamoyltransferase HypF [Helicobacter sp. MIT 14-3879]|uniref:carbamoyltransferase HypF n=1 Tax=Helicobacter sp. MIT 14-3879 TaxID=2040649 RepID=UPI000E1F21D9|nr:carbamoyltransferase HypF [Helicobacter sp. MIT 14-3879]RDU64018.1 carbamoyltransferase HypF [Helicobacter sp. MIT 14-3879]
MISIEITIFGIVQGVGFRPFIYNLARKYNIKGYVKNVDSNLLILAQHKDSKKISYFISDIKDSPPKNAKISDIKISKIALKNTFYNFIIKKSDNTNECFLDSAIPLDLSICKECLKELNDKNNKRFNYAFINCINCGPRYSIIDSLPYDRERTSMNKFIMCESCKNEYDDILDRRFHAQPNSCNKCGINLKIYDKFNNEFSSDIFKMLSLLLSQNKILAIKGIGGFNLLCSVNFETISILRERKKRERKPFAIMFRDITQVKRYFDISIFEENLLLSSHSPIVLLKNPKIKFPYNLSFNLNTFGVIIAYSPLHKLIFKYRKTPLIFTSANISNGVLIKDKDEAFEKIGHIFDYLLDYDREILNVIDDSLQVILGDNKALLLRSGRGLYPLFLKTNFYSNDVILALGAHQKSQISIFYKKNIIISPYIGDLNSIDVIFRMQQNIEFLLKTYNLTPNIILRDCHNLYESSKIASNLAKKYNAKIYKIYHHRAHFYSNLVDNNLLNSDNILGVIFDGTGLGEDKDIQRIWGGEFFIKQNNTLKRILHFSYFPLLGGDNAIKDIKKVALGVLFSVYDNDIPSILKHKFENIDIFYQMYKQGINSPQTSSIGRIFDCIAFFCGLEYQNFDGESGGYIESLYDKKIKQFYKYEINNDEISFSLMIKSMICDLKESNYKTLIASKFINTLTDLILNIALKYKINVIFSGGVFANKVLCDRIIYEFKKHKKHKIKYFMHNNIPPNDSGISIGQIGAFINNDVLEIE